jgi:hypothetical protein
MESNPSLRLPARRYHAVLERLYDDGQEVFVYMIESRTCDSDVYWKNVAKLDAYLKSKKKKMVWRTNSDGVRVGEKRYAERKIREFHCYVCLSGLLKKKSFDPHNAAKQFEREHRVQECFPEKFPPKPASVKKRDTKGDLTMTLITLDKRGMTTRALERETIEITRRSLGASTITPDVVEKHRKRVSDAFRNNKELFHRRASKKKK